jgi:hypothetical protein
MKAASLGEEKSFGIEYLEEVSSLDDIFGGDTGDTCVIADVVTGTSCDSMADCTCDGNCGSGQGGA